MKSKNLFILSLCALLFTCFSCNTTQEESDKLLIVTTTGIIGDCIQQIVGDKAEVISIMGAGVDPHLYKASQGDLEKLSKADVIIYNGLHLEGKMAQVLEKMSSEKTAIAVGSFASENELKRVDETSDLHDPHIWFNPVLWMKCMQGVVSELEKIPGLEGIQSNFESYNLEVEEMYETLKSKLDADLPIGKRVLITSHDAFEYFGDAFTFEVRGLQGISTAAEYGIKDVKDLIDFVMERKIRAVFIETSVSDKNLKSVVAGARAQKYELKIGGTLYSDALGEASTEAGSYIGMITANVNTIIEGLK